MAFDSFASNLAPNDTNGIWDIFIKDLHTGLVRIVSSNSEGVIGNGESSFFPSISAEGRFVAFQSYASNLVSGDRNNHADVFVKDLHTGQTRLVSTGYEGFQGNDDSRFPSISADGRFVAFVSRASNLEPNDWNGTEDVFVKDLQTGETRIVSTDSGGAHGDNSSWDPSISADGRFVAFWSVANNLAAETGDEDADVFLKDLQTGQIRLVSTGYDNSHGNGNSWCPSISADGRFVAFESRATNLVTEDGNNYSDVFVKDMQTNQMIVVSTGYDSSQGNHDSYWPSISADGRFVAFESVASNLVSKDSNSTYRDVFVRDLLMGQTRLASVNSQGAQGYCDSFFPSISATGRWVAFSSWGTSLVSNDTNDTSDIFVRETGIFSLSLQLTVSPSSCPGNAFSIGTVTLSNSAPSGGATVTLSSTNTSVATFPATVTIPAGMTSAKFRITTKAVNTETNISVSGTWNGNSAKATLRVLSATAIAYSGANVALTGTGPNSRIIQGIVCDNYRALDRNQLNKLWLFPALNRQGSVTKIWGYLCNPQGAPLNDSQTAAFGSVEAAGSKLWYYPPFEFNERQSPTTTGQLTTTATRSVYARVVFQTDQGLWYSSSPFRIVLARPPIVFVHGINNDWTNWGLRRLVPEGPRVHDGSFLSLLRSISTNGFPFAMANHGSIFDYHGRGTVELAADRVQDKISVVLEAIRRGEAWLPGQADIYGLWDDPYTVYRDVGPLSALRVDVVGHSYGGMAARWLIADRPTGTLSEVENSGAWYLRKGGTTNYLRTDPYRGQVRKLITIGSMWRGVPLANAAVEALAGGGSSEAYGNAPVSSTLFSNEKNVRDLLTKLPGIEGVQQPAWQPMAVESPWNRYLLYGELPDGTMADSLVNFPFRQTVGYASIVGDDADYSFGLNLYEKYDQWQTPSWFPYFALESAVGQESNYSDGIVPVWSAAIPGAYEIFPYDHAQLILEQNVVDQVLVWCNTASLKSGKELGQEWNNPSSWPVARDSLKYRWLFGDPKRMAPWPQNTLYQMRPLIEYNLYTRYVARFGGENQEAYRERASVQAKEPSPSAVTLFFHTNVPVNWLQCVVFDAQTNVQVAVYPFQKVAKLNPGPIERRFWLGSNALTRGKCYRAVLYWRSEGAGLGKSIVQLECDPVEFTVP